MLKRHSFALIPPASVLCIALGSFASFTVLGDGTSDYQAGRYSEALPQLYPLAKQGDVRAIAMLCEAELLGRGIPKNPTPRNVCFKAANAGDPLAMGIVGQAYLRKLPQMTINYGEGLRLLNAAYSQGDLRATRALGTAYVMGWGVPVSSAQGISFLEKAWSRGDAQSAVALGTIYLFGKGVPVDEQKGLALMEAAAQRGDPLGLYRIYIYYTTKPKPSTDDFSRGVSALKRASDASSPEAQLEYGKMLVKGDLVRQNKAAGFASIVKAADHGVAAARAYAAYAYANGDGMPQDFREASKLLQANFSAVDPYEVDRAHTMYAAICMTEAIPNCQPGYANSKEHLGYGVRSRYPTIAKWAQELVSKGEAAERRRLEIELPQAANRKFLGEVLQTAIAGLTIGTIAYYATGGEGGAFDQSVKGGGGPDTDFWIHLMFNND